MVSRNGWPEEPNIYVGPTDTGQAEAAALFHHDRWQEVMDKAKADAVQLEFPESWNGVLPTKDVIRPDTFIIVDIEVEFGEQWQRGNGEWIDIIDNTPINVYTPIRTIARVVPEKPVNDLIFVDGGPTEYPRREFIAHQDETYKKLALSFGSSIKKKQEELDAANKRVKELEDYLADRITEPTADMIVDKFCECWADPLSYNSAICLRKVLDELGIK